jgi:hypothetical protein
MISMLFNYIDKPYSTLTLGTALDGRQSPSPLTWAFKAFRGPFHFKFLLILLVLGLAPQLILLTIFFLGFRGFLFRVGLKAFLQLCFDYTAFIYVHH